MKKYIPYITAIVSLLCINKSSAQLTTRVIAEDLFIPWEMQFNPIDKHIWFTQKNGYICRVNPQTKKVDTLYHETNTTIQAEGGMLGLVLHPDFTNNPYVYVAYNYTQSGYKERVVRYTYNGTALGSPLILIDDIPSANFHNGSRLLIISNQLYITTGDATNTSTSQNINVINGKTLRINLDGSIPSDNPFIGSSVWSWGHRNAQGLAYGNNKIYSSEHGPANDDEVNILEKGRNYGWPNVEGYCNTPSEMTFCNDSNVVEPIIAWTPTIAVSGMVYYNHPMFPNFKNSLLMATLKNKNLYHLKLNNSNDGITSSDTIVEVTGDRLRAVCVDTDGRIYISTSNSKASGNSTFIDKIIEIYDPNYSSVSETLNSKNQQVVLFPNPTQADITVFTSMNSPTTVYDYSILNRLGQVVAKGSLGSGYNIISTSELASGMYWLQVVDNDTELSNTKFQKL